MSTLACYFPADSADHADEYSKLHYFAEKDRLFEVKVVLGFGGLGVCLRLSARDLLFSLCKLLEYSYVFIFPQIAQITQTNTASCIITQRKTGWGWL